MAQFICTNAKVFADQYDISGYLSTTDIQTASDMHDVTPYGATEHRMIPGLASGTWTAEGFTEFGTTPAKIEKILHTLKSTQDKPFTIVPHGATIGNLAYFLSASFQGFEFGADHGNPNTFVWNGGTSKWQLIRGKIEELNTTARVATGNSPGAALGAVTATQFLYAAVHVTAGTGTMDIIVESETGGAFGSPTTVITFPQFTGAGSGIMRVAGPITDDNYRFKWTLASSPSFTFAAVFGIL